MKLNPSANDFRRTYGSGKAQVVWTELVSDLETPVSAMLKLCRDMPNSFLLESVEAGETRGRYSIIGFKPDLIWRCYRGVVAIERDPTADQGAFGPAPTGNEADCPGITPFLGKIEPV